MEMRTGGEAQQKVTVLLEEMGAMLSAVPRLLEENAALKSAGDLAQREMEHLRTELAGLRSEIQTFTAERNEFQQIFTKSMNEIIDLMNQVLPRLQAPPKRTAFEREPAGLDYASRPAPAASTGWRQ